MVSFWDGEASGNTIGAHVGEAPKGTPPALCEIGHESYEETNTSFWHANGTAPDEAKRDCHRIQPDRHDKTRHTRVVEKLRASKSTFSIVLRGEKEVPANWQGQLPSACKDLGKKQTALMTAGSPEMLALAKLSLKCDFFAAATVKAYESEVRLYGQCCQRSMLQA